MRASSPPSLSWLRSLLMLARAEASGTLWLRAHGRTASLLLSRGQVLGFEGELGPRLGELVGLTRAEGIEGSVGQSWGVAAVAAGRVSRGDLAWALRRQIRLRAREIARWGEIEARWEAGEGAPRPFTDPMSTADLVAEVLRAFAESLPAEPAPVAPVASALGRFWAERAALFPHELAAVHGTIRSPASARFAQALAAAGLTDAPVEPEVRALTQLHARVRHEGPRAVLGEERDPSARRRALRRVAGSIHPDRFANDPRLGVISSELVASLASR
ncbi:MAG: hypothetical protein K1X94_18375 [Sandaracinaceae bacterium]|nr:hypothetical protein [Sandaracinaceae bacterium]